MRMPIEVQISTQGTGFPMDRDSACDTVGASADNIIAKQTSHEVH
jgi:hypothetical protein